MQIALEEVINVLGAQKTAKITDALKPKFDKTGVLGSTLRNRSRSVSSARKERKSYGKKNVAEDTSEESEVEGSDSRCKYNHSETKRSDGCFRTRK
jgi:hypothetical protein